MAGIKNGLLLGNYQVGFIRSGIFDGLRFYVNGTASCDPLITKLAGVATWNFGDGSGDVTGDNPTHVYGDTNRYKVELEMDTDMSDITSIEFDNDDIDGVLNLSKLTGLNPGASNFKLNGNLNMTGVIFPDVPGSTFTGNFWVFGTGVSSLDFSGFDNIAYPVLYDNASLTSVTFKASSYVMSGIDIQNCDALVTLDLSMLTGLGGVLRFQNSALLSSITLPTSSTAITEFNANSTALTGTLDLSGLTGLGGDIQVTANSSLTSVTFPTSSQATTKLWLFNNDLTGTLDISGMTGLAGSVILTSNNNLTSITNPTSTGVVTSYQVQLNTGLTSLDVSGLSNLKNDIRANGCTSMTSVTLPTSSQAIDVFHFQDCDITGTFDFSGLSNVGGQIRGYNNPNMTSVTFPTTSRNASELLFNDCNLTGSINFSGMTAVADTISFANNPLLTGITFPTSIRNGSLNCSGCDLTGTVDISGMSLKNSLNFNGNANMTAITMPSSTQSINTIRMDATGLTSFDCSGLTNISNLFRVDACSSLTSLTLPTMATNTINTFNAHDCDLGYVDFTVISSLMDVNNATITLQNNGMTAAEVNQILVDLDGLTDGLYTGRSINIAGTNAAPDTTSGGYDGDAAKTSLVGKGITVTTN